MSLDCLMRPWRHGRSEVKLESQFTGQVGESARVQVSEVHGQTWTQLHSYSGPG